MSTARSLVPAALLIFGAGVLLPATSSADPIRITVSFTATGDAADPEFGGVSGVGSFSLVTDQAPGSDGRRPEGFGLEAISFTWAGTTWDTAGADVYRVGREPSGRIYALLVGGRASGLDVLSPSAAPDFLLDFCVADVMTPETDCSRIVLQYVTERSAPLGVFTAFVPSFSILREPTDVAPVPEPLTLVLVGSGLCGIAIRRRSARLSVR